MSQKLKEKQLKYTGGLGFKAFGIDTSTLNINTQSRTISGFGAIFGNIDEDRDRLIKGCFARSIAERGPASAARTKIAMLWQHDIKEPIGCITTLEERPEGLYFEAVLDEGVPRADQALKQLESGSINSFSIGYQYVWDKMEYNHVEDAFDVAELKLLEISVVTIPANDQTYYTGLKSAHDFENEQNILTDKINTFIKKLNNEDGRELSELFMRQKALSHRTLASCSKEQVTQSTVANEQKKYAFFDGIKIKL
jgi:HK97 family phage prohead protease